MSSIYLPAAICAVRSGEYFEYCSHSEGPSFSNHSEGDLLATEIHRRKKGRTGICTLFPYKENKRLRRPTIMKHLSAYCRESARKQSASTSNIHEPKPDSKRTVVSAFFHDILRVICDMKHQSWIAIPILASAASRERVSKAGYNFQEKLAKRSKELRRQRPKVS